MTRLVVSLVMAMGVLTGCNAVSRLPVGAPGPVSAMHVIPVTPGPLPGHDSRPSASPKAATAAKSAASRAILDPNARPCNPYATPKPTRPGTRAIVDPGSQPGC